MKKMKVLAICAIALFSAVSAHAQFATGTDIVSSYIWRGIPQGNGLTPNLQPSLSFTTGALSLGSWASGSFTGDVKEVDLYATYAISSAFALTVTDYNYNLITTPNYFDYKNGHVFEGTLAYTGPKFSASVNTMFAGNDKLANGDNAFSTYFEMDYQFNPMAKVFLGGSLANSLTYGTTGFGITNVGLKVSKSIAITDKFSLPLYGILSANPYSGKAFFVVGVTL
ncbi:MAG: hypothetical protein P4L34_06510 [Paludibacter sp.]|nr:hypothetical protein [Paludibacter sp.]